METTDIRTTVDTVVAQMTGLVISDEPTYSKAAEFLLKTKETQKIVKAHFEPDRKRTHEAYKAVTDDIKRFTDVLSNAERVVKRKMSDYQTEQQRKRREEEERRRREEEERLLAQAAETGNEQLLEAPVVVQAPPEPEKVEGISFVTEWKYEIVDEAQIPRQYLLIDHKKIGQIARAMKDTTNIPGVRVYSEQSVRARPG